MTVYAVQFHFYGQDRSHEGKIRDAMSKADALPAPRDGGEAKRYGIFCFSQVDENLFNNLQDYRRQTHSRVIALAATSTLLTSNIAWELLRAGASEVLAWTEQGVTDQIHARLARWSAVDDLAARATQRESLVGRSTVWSSLVRRVVEAAGYSNVPVLLTGESGTGKEQLARLVHAARSEGNGATQGDFVTVDCSTIVSELSGSEFFGHERGAFTGAHTQREGAFAFADGSTLFLDEVGELPFPLQAQLLRVIQEKQYKRVGGNVWHKTNFRLVCATNRDLAELVRRGEFRLDLYHRIAGWIFRTPSIRERREDILPLAQHFLTQSFPANTPELDAAVCDFLLNRSYDGNVRELRQLIERMAHKHAGTGPITVGDIPEEDRPAANVSRAWPDEDFDRTIAGAIAVGVSLREISAAATQAAIRIAVHSEEGNLQRAAKRLGVTDRALQMRRAAGM